MVFLRSTCELAGSTIGAGAASSSCTSWSLALPRSASSVSCVSFQLHPSSLHHKVPGSASDRYIKSDAGIHAD